MMNHQNDTDIPQVGWNAEEQTGTNWGSAPYGMYHLVFREGWDCRFISDGCLELLECPRDSFLEVLRACTVYMGADRVQTAVGDILDQLARTPGQQRYSGIAQHWNGVVRRIESSLISVRARDGGMEIYGQVADVTDQFERSRTQLLDREVLLQAAQIAFPEIISMNLTQKTYRVIRYDNPPIMRLPESGHLGHLMEVCVSYVAQEDRAAFISHFSLDNQLKGIQEGRREIRFTYRQQGAGNGWIWMETIIRPQANPFDGDLLTFAVSRNITEEKARERRLLEQIRRQAEELNITMTQMGNHISYYDVISSSLTTLPHTAREFGLPLVMKNYPEDFLANPPEGYPPETGELLRRFIGAIRRGEPTGSCDYPTVNAAGRRIWLHREFATIFDEKQRPVRAVISSEDVTERYEYDHQREVNRAGLIKVAQLVFPDILSINLTQGTCAVIQGAGELPRELPLDVFLNTRLEEVIPEDREAYKQQFFRDQQLAAIAGGKERLQLTYRRREADGVCRWIETIVVRHENPYNDDILTFAVSHNVDQQKAQEELLRQALADSAEQLEGWMYYNSLSSQSFPGLIYVNYDDGRQSPYAVGTLAERLDCPARELALSTCFRIPREDIGALQRAQADAAYNGEQTFQAQYRVLTDRGRTVWISNNAVRFRDKDGGTGYIHFLTDITHEHVLMEQVRTHMEERLKKNEQTFNIVAQHSNRILYQYDLSTGVTHPWDKVNQEKDVLSHLYTGTYTDDAVEDNSSILPESREDTRRFFTDIHSGVPSGEMNIHVRLKEGRPRWYHFKYSSLFEEGKPVTALISVEDITERHEHELAYLRHKQAVDLGADNTVLYLEACLICNRVELLSGQLLSEAEVNQMFSYTNFSREFMDSKFMFEELERSSQYFSRENLLSLYAQGQRQLDSGWQVRFADGSMHWLGVELTIMADPFNNHVKAFIRMMDVTEEQEEQLSLVRRADHDAMTGLLRRDAGEARIRDYLSAHKKPGGIMVALDLDDLKGINDNLGHAWGDQAIQGLATALKGHFRADDILIRAGGDEFILFLPGAGKNPDAVKASVAALQEKLSGISVGEHGERVIQCSIGCAVELPDTDTFDSLYQRADMALYHVKRNGKNGFAFFTPELLEERADQELAFGD